jgi:hypothetical protein
MSAAALAAARALVEAEAEFSVGLAVSDDEIAAAHAMARAHAAGVRMTAAPGRRVQLEADAAPSQDVVEGLKRCREDVRRLLAGEAPPPATRRRFRVRGGGV